MAAIQINYDEVYAKSTQLRKHIAEDISGNAEKEYNRIIQKLEQLDGAANAELISAIEQNKQKTLMVSKIMDKLLSFMSNSSKQVEINEQRMAYEIFRGV